MIIRDVNPETDSQAITAIYNPFITGTVVTFETTPLNVDDMRRRITLTASKFPYFVCETEGKVVGYAYVHEWRERHAFFKTAETSVYVAPAYRKSGIGKALMQKLIAECMKRGFAALIAMIDGENETSHRFHESLGFMKVAHYRNVGFKFNRFLDLLSYELLLRQTNG